MPKYIPTPDELYIGKPCFICGNDVFDVGEDTCCDICKLQKQIFDEDWGRSLWEELESRRIMEDHWEEGDIPSEWPEV